MTPYKNFLAATQSFFNSNAFLKFLLSAYIFIFAAGGLFFLLGLFILQVKEAFVCIGSILIWSGLILTVIREDALTIVISSGVIALGGLVGWIVDLAGRSYFYGNIGGVFSFTPFFYFLAFCAIGIVVLIKAEKFKQMRAASASKAAGYACPRCGGFVSVTAAFCPNCGAKRPAPQPPYTPPAQPYAAPAYPSSPVPSAAPAPPAEPAAPVVTPAAGSKCASCGADLPEGAVFCGKCGTKQ